MHTCTMFRGALPKASACFTAAVTIVEGAGGINRSITVVYTDSLFLVCTVSSIRPFRSGTYIMLRCILELCRHINIISILLALVHNW